MDEVTLYRRFNKREPSAFSEVYSIVYNEIHSYTAKLYRETEVEACDVIHDVLLHIWHSKELLFDDARYLKAYIYIAIKNRFKDYLTHQKYVDKYKNHILSNDNHYYMAAIESEYQSLFAEMVAKLPENYSEVIRLHIEGWDVKSIAEKLNITEKSVFNRKRKAIELMKYGANTIKALAIINILTEI